MAIRRWRIGGLVLLLLAAGVGRMPGEAGVQTGNPGAGVTASIPSSATVTPFANVTWTDCLFGTVNPVSGGSCAASAQIATNVDLSIRMQAAPLVNGSGNRLLSSYAITLPSGNTVTVNPDTGKTAQVFQAGAPLTALASYPIAGTATNDPGSTVAGTYVGQILFTLVSAATDLAAPTGLTAQAGENQITASWNAVSGATSYELAYQPGTTFDPSTATIVSVTGTSYTITGLTNGQTYTLAVRSVFSSTKSGWSAAVQVTMQPPVTALQFDGVNDYVVFASGFGKPNAITISLRFKATGPGVLFGQTTAQPPTVPGAFVPTLWVRSDGRLRAELWNGTQQGIFTSSSVLDGQWHQVVLLGNSTGQTLYVDNVLIGNLSGAIDQGWWTTTLLGTGYSSNRGSTAGWFYSAGQLRDVRLYNRALSGTEVTALFAGNPPSTGLIGAWPLNDGSGCQATPSAGSVAGQLKPNCPSDSPQWVTQ